MYSKQENLVINEIIRTTKQNLNQNAIKTTSGNDFILDYYNLSQEKFFLPLKDIKTNKNIDFGKYKVIDNSLKDKIVKIQKIYNKKLIGNSYLVDLSIKFVNSKLLDYAFNNFYLINSHK